jgi:ATP-dependent helicase HrpB
LIRSSNGSTRMNRDPIQITKDLNSFWKETYPKIKPELSRHYPKHKWL